MSQASVISAGAVLVEGGLELLDSSDVLIKDISDELIKGQVTRKSAQKIHGSARFTMTDAYNWESQRLRPYITITDIEEDESYRWDLGVYLPETPARVAGYTPAIYEVEAYDKLMILDTPYGSTYRIASGVAYIASVQTLLAAAGVSYSIDQTEAATTLPTDLVWEISEKNTTLKMVNELLSAIGYVNIYTDRSGIFRSGPWVAPSGRSMAWHYNADDDDGTIVSSVGSMTDLFDIPNKWVFVRDDPDPGITLPSAGAGIYTVTNQSDGITSIDSRGRTITKIVFLKTASHAALEDLGDAIVEADSQPVSVVSLAGRTNPLHWHESSVQVTSSDLGLTAKAYAELGWTLPLDGSKMKHDLVEAVA